MSNTKKLLGSDIRLDFAIGRERSVDNPSFAADLAVNERGDLDLIGDSEEEEVNFNIVQAILHRLTTIKGELSDIGHPYYGSTLYDMIGEPNNESTRGRVKLIVRDTLLQEPRIKEIRKIDVRPRRNELDAVDVDVDVLPIGSNVPLNLVFPFYLEVI